MDKTDAINITGELFDKYQNLRDKNKENTILFAHYSEIIDVILEIEYEIAKL